MHTALMFGKREREPQRKTVSLRIPQLGSNPPMFEVLALSVGNDARCKTRELDACSQATTVLPLSLFFFGSSCGNYER